MPKNKKIKGRRHSDKKFITGFDRFYWANRIKEEQSFGSLEKSLDKTKADKQMTTYWLEYQLFNVNILLEHEVCALLQALYETGKLDAKQSRDKILNHICRYQKWTKDGELNIRKANAYLRNKFYEHKKKSAKIKKIDDVLFNAYFLVDTCGLTLGTMSDILSKCTSNKIWKPYNLVEKMLIFYQYRNHLIHHLLSSRWDYEDLLKKGPVLGKELLERIEMLIEHLMIDSTHDEVWLKNLKKRDHQIKCYWCKATTH